MNATSFESAYQQAVSSVPSGGDYQFGKTTSGTFKTLAYVDYVGTEKVKRTGTHYEIRILKLSGTKFLLVAGYFADYYNRTTALTPFYKIRLSNLFKSALGGIEKLK